MNPSFQRVNASDSSATAKRKVKSEEVEERMVLEVTEVRCSDMLNASWAQYHSGATWGAGGGEGCRGWGAAAQAARAGMPCAVATAIDCSCNRSAECHQAGVLHWHKLRFGRTAHKLP